MSARVSGCFWIVLSVSLIVTAECPDADNLVSNCGLETDISGWAAAFNSTADHSTADANTGTGSFELTMVGLPGQSNWTAEGECVTLTANATYRYGGWYRWVGGTSPNICQTQIRVKAGGSDCSGGLATITASSVSGLTSWKKSENTYTATATGDAAKITIRCQGGAAGTTILADDMFLGIDADLERRADIAISKSNGQNLTAAGSTVTYTIAASNAGPDDVTGATVADLFPASLGGPSWTCAAAGGATCTITGSGDINEPVDLPAGAVVTFTATADVSSGATGTLINVATVSLPAGFVDPAPGDASATDGDALVQIGDLAVVKGNGVSAMVPGNNVTYTIEVSNAGPSDMVALVTDTFPPQLSGIGWTCAAGTGASCTAVGSGNISDSTSLTAGSSVTYTVLATVSAGATGTLTNTATVSAQDGTDTIPVNNSSTDSDPLTPEGDLSVSKTDGLTAVVPGETVTYTVTIANAGPSDATGATAGDSFPAALNGVSWVCMASPGSSCGASGNGDITDSVNILAGGSVTYTAVATVDPGATGTLSNTATVNAPVGFTDTVGGNDSATDDDTTLTPVADLVITKDNGIGFIGSGDAVTYTVVVSNGGPSAVTVASVEDLIPAEIITCTWSCVPGTGGSCSPAPTDDLTDQPDLDAGGWVTYTGLCSAGSIATAATIDNTVTVSVPGGVSDPVPTNNTATDSDLGPFIFGDGFESAGFGMWSSTSLGRRPPQQEGQESSGEQ